MKRRKLITLIGGLAIACPLAAYAQHPKQPLKRVGVLAAEVPCPLQPDDLIVRRLGELGWVEGQNLAFDCVSAIGRIDQGPALARELVSRRPDVLMAAPYRFVSALRQETTTTPIVMPDPGWPGHPTDIAAQVEATSSLLNNAEEPEHNKDDSQHGTEDS